MYTAKHYPAVKRKGPLTCARTCINLGETMQREISQLKETITTGFHFYEVSSQIHTQKREWQ